MKIETWLKYLMVASICWLVVIAGIAYSQMAWLYDNDAVNTIKEGFSSSPSYSKLTNAEIEYDLEKIAASEMVKYLTIAFGPILSFLALGASVYFGRKFLLGRNEANMPDQKSTGLGGWLIIVGLGIIIAPIPIIIETFKLSNELFANGGELFQFELGVKAHDPVWEVIFLGLLVIKGVLALVWIYIGFLFFTKKKAFPKWYIGILLFLIVYILIGELAAHFMYPDPGRPFFNRLVLTLKNN